MREELAAIGYRLIQEIGRGGNGIVYLAEKTAIHLSRKVAIKVFDGQREPNSLLNQFESERTILATLNHPNITKLFDYGITRQGFPYLVMEYVDGRSPLDYANHKRLDLFAKIRLFIQICSAVSFAHRNAIIHRDLKPTNILVTDEGIVKLLDFGVAKLLETEGLIVCRSGPPTNAAMTPEYASPEQLRNEPLTTLTDVYSLGIILFELLTGSRPYGASGDDLQSMVRRICDDQTPKPSEICEPAIADSLRGDLDTIVLKSLSKPPERRYSSVDSLSADLQRFLDGFPVLARPDSTGYRVKKFIRRNRGATAAACSSILITICLITGALWQSSHANSQKELAEKRFVEVRTLANSLLFELNDEIEKGQTPAAELLVTRAKEYLDKLADSGEGNEIQRDLAFAYIKIGDIQGKPYSPNLGQTEQSLVSYQKALAVFDGLVDAGVDDDETLRGQALAQISMTQHHSHRGDHPTAIKFVEPALATLRQLNQRNPDDGKTLRLLVEGYRSLGDAGSTTEARLEAYFEALRLGELLLALEPAAPDNLVLIASASQRLGTRLGAVADHQSEGKPFFEALSHFDRSREIYRSLVLSDPSDIRHKVSYANLTSIRVPLLGRLGRYQEAIDSHAEALTIFEGVAKTDPQNVESTINIAYTLQEGCRGFLLLTELPRAVSSCRRGLKIAEALMKNDASNQEMKRYARRSFHYLAEAYEKMKNIGELTNLIQEAKRFEAYWSGDPPLPRDYRSEIIATVEQRIGNVYSHHPTDRRLINKRSCLQAREWHDRSRARFNEMLRIRHEADYVEAIAHIDTLMLSCK